MNRLRRLYRQVSIRRAIPREPGWISGRFSREIIQELERGSWLTNKEILGLLPRWEASFSTFEMFSKARVALMDYGGLCWSSEKPGIERARFDFKLDPVLVLGNEEFVEECADALGRRMFPLGEGELGYGTLMMSDEGRVYFYDSTSSGDVWCEGDTMEGAIENMVLGRSTPTVLRYRGGIDGGWDRV